MRRYATLIALLGLLTVGSATAQDIEIVSLDLHQVTFEYAEPPYVPSTIGQMDLVYIPPDSGLFINVVATDSPTSPVGQWIVQNVYLPAASWNPNQQMISVRFDASLVGAERGVPMGYLRYSVRTSRRSYADSPGLDFTGATETTVTPIRVNAAGGVPIVPGDGPRIGDGFYYPHPLEVDRDSLEIRYEGCHIPNLDLDSTITPGDWNGCGPAAVANSMKWLSNSREDVDIPLELRALYERINDLMGRLPKQPVNHLDFIRAKLDLIEAYNLPLRVTFQIDEDDPARMISSSSGHTSATEMNSDTVPDFNWMADRFKDSCDVEMWVTDDFGKAHVITVSGYSRNPADPSDPPRLKYKHDRRQDTTGGQEQVTTAVGVDPWKGRMWLHDFFGDGGDGMVSLVVAECPDPGYQPAITSGTLTFTAACRWSRILVPPHSKVTFDYPNILSRCFNTEIYEAGYPHDDAYVKVAAWNFNGGKNRVYANNSDEPRYIRFKNDDNGFGKKDAGPISIDWRIDRAQSTMRHGKDPRVASASDTTSASNPEAYGGFSVGGYDSTSAEFGDHLQDSLAIDCGIGLALPDVPRLLGVGGVGRLRLNHPIAQSNEYWNDLELMVGVDSVVSAGSLRITSAATGIDTAIMIDTAGEYYVLIGDAADAGSFDLTLEPSIGSAVRLDNVGVLSVLLRGTLGVDGEDAAGGSLSIEPNPTTGTAMLHLTLARSARVAVHVVDARGVERAATGAAVLAAGAHALGLPLDGLAAGAYVVRVELDGRVVDRRVVLLR